MNTSILEAGLRVAAVLSISVILAACGADTTGSETGRTDTRADTDAGAVDGLDGTDADASDSVDGTDAGGADRHCDPIDPVRCVLPWPSGKFLSSSSETETGYRLKFGPKTFPEPAKNKRLKPKNFPKLDGYGLGAPIMAVFPNVDTSQLAGKYSVGRSMKDDAPIVLLKVKPDGSTDRVPYWTELDVYAKDNPDEQILFVRPAEILRENSRYIVAFRDLKNESGEAIEPSKAFSKLKSNQTRDGTELGARQKHFNEIFEILEGAGLERKSLTLAWDFHTASSDTLHGTLRDIIDKGFDAVGPKGPELTVDKVEEFPEDEHLAFEIKGTFEVPKYTRRWDGKGQILNRNDKGKVTQNGTRDALFIARVPESALEQSSTQVVTFGHGLLGKAESVRLDLFDRVADNHNYIVIGANMTGMARDDVSVAMNSAVNFNNFVAITDRLHQGVMEYTLLPRAMAKRLDKLDALQERDITVNDEQQYYVGLSQGGILGQTLMTLTPDIDRAFLGVPGNNYVTLLQRSTGFKPFFGIMKNVYTTAADRAIILAGIQLMWDRIDPVNYIRRIKQNPFDGESKNVLIAISKGDYQVDVSTNEKVARSGVGIPIMEPYDETRKPWGVETATYPHDGSGIVLFDFGNPWPDNGNQPPEDDMGDPHPAIAGVDEIGQQLDAFFQTGQIIDICNGGPCQFEK